MKMKINNDYWTMISDDVLYLRKNGTSLKISKNENGFCLYSQKGNKSFNTICSNLNIAVELAELMCKD